MLLTNIANPAPEQGPFGALMALAAFLQPVEDAIQAGWRRLDGPFTLNDMEALVQTTARANRILAACAPFVAEITGNSLNNIRAFSPELLRTAVVRDDRGIWRNKVCPLDVWFSKRPAEFLRNVARFRSFNAQARSKLDGSMRRQ